MVNTGQIAILTDNLVGHLTQAGASVNAIRLAAGLTVITDNIVLDGALGQLYTDAATASNHLESLFIVTRMCSSGSRTGTSETFLPSAADDDGIVRNYFTVFRRTTRNSGPE